MTEFMEFLDAIDNPEHRARTQQVLQWVTDTFPQLGRRIAWGQPTFTDHGTFIMAFSLAKAHLAVAPETVTLERFSQRIEQAGYTYTKMLMRIKWDQPVDHDLLKDMIAFNIEDKKDHKGYWRVPTNPGKQGK